MDLSIIEQVAYSTVRIECHLPDDRVATGTGFFYGLRERGGGFIPVIITNKHVVDGAAKGKFVMAVQDANGGPKAGSKQEFLVDRFASQWIPHPDETVDLCAMPIAPLLKAAEQEGSKVFHSSFAATLIPTPSDVDDMMGMESIAMVGYPNGLWDEVNNLPIFRRGILASHYRWDWNGKKEFLIDAACFPGSSGSPVMLLDAASYQTRRGLSVGARIKLLGILYAGPQYTVEGKVEIVEVPTRQEAVSVAMIPNNLGIVIKAERLLAFESVCT